jgi:hypothetical protein
MLHIAHPQSFTAYPALLPEEEMPGPNDGVQFLLGASVRDRTRAYVGAIDTLLARHGDEVSSVHLENWPDMRARILRDYPD